MRFVSYFFISPGLFQIDRETGVIETAKPLDYEAAPTHSFLVMCEDSYDGSGTAQSLTHTAMVTIIVRVVDINDNVPVFSQEIYNVDVVEGSTAWSLIQVVIFKLKITVAYAHEKINELNCLKNSISIGEFFSYPRNLQ